MQTSLEFDLPSSKVDNLFQRFEEIHNSIYANDGLSSQQTLEEIIKILFIKIFDENNPPNQFFIESDENSEIKIKNSSKSFISRISDLFEKTKKEFKDIFEPDEKIRLSHQSLSISINKLQNISLTSSTNDAKGLAFQKFLAHQEKGSRGQFFTPEPVVDFCVNFIQPQPNEKIIDPACGSGGFLYSTLRFILKNNPTLKPQEIITNNIFGVDINRSIAKIAKMKFLLESNTNVNIFCANSLGDIDDLNLLAKSSKKIEAVENSFDVVLTNPPFGTQGKITSESILKHFDLGHKWELDRDHFFKSSTLHNGQVAEILFIERCLCLLKEGGRLGIVLPNGHFENSSLDYLRYFIKEKAKILGVVNLPQETFVPFGTGVKTTLLFLEKDTANVDKKYKVFFGKVTKLGYQGNKNALPIYIKDKYGNPIKDKEGKQILDEDFSEILGAYKASKNGNFKPAHNSFTADFDEINDRIDFDYYSPEYRGLIIKLQKSDSVKLVDLVDIIKKKSKLLSYPNKIVNYVELSDINTHSSEIINATEYIVHELPSRASYDIQAGDIITSVAGNSVGTSKHATALVTADYEGCICTNGFRVLRNFKVDSFFLIYYLHSEYFLKQMFMYRTGAAIPSVSDSDFEQILIKLPNEDVLKEISNKIKNAFTLRDKARKELDSLIYELV